MTKDDNMVKVEDLISITNKLISDLSEEYNIFIDILYKDSYLENPEAFILSDSNNIDAFILKTNNDIFGFNYIMMFYQGSGKTEYLGEIPIEKYSKLKNFSDTYDFLRSIIEEKSIVQKYYFFDNNYIDFIINRIERNHVTVEAAYSLVSDSLWQQNYKPNVLKQLKSDGQAFVDHINHDSSYYVKDAFKYTYSDLNFEEIIEIVNNPDFEYALNESLAAYDNSLYLASTVTAGVALENLLLTILEKESIDVGDNELTELGVLSSKLLKNNVIDKREKSRIMLASKYRNLASHANKGRVIRSDSKTIYTEIFNLASTYFDI